MSFNTKITLISLIILIGIPAGGFWYYRRTHPLTLPPLLRPEVTITIIPGWNLRQVAEYLVKQEFASSTADVFKLVGTPARDYRMVGMTRGPFINFDLPVLKDKNNFVSYEGYLAPETYRVFRDATLTDVLHKLISQRDKEISSSTQTAIKNSGRSLFEVLTMASIIEREVKYDEDRSKVADVLWRREARGWALQVDSSVHYAVDRTGDVFTTEAERKIDSPWNTYKHPGLPPGPICNPSTESIVAAANPQKNDYWYFLSDIEGRIHYGRTLEDHAANRAKYLK